MEEYLYGFNNVCVFSSLIFITNVILSYFYKKYIYLFLFSCLLITSTTCHYTQNYIIILIDKCFVYLIICYGFYVMYNKEIYEFNIREILYIYIIIISFLSCVYLYLSGLSVTPFEIYGIKGNFLHAFLHIIGSIGHNVIAIL